MYHMPQKNRVVSTRGCEHTIVPQRQIHSLVNRTIGLDGQYVLEFSVKRQQL